MSSLLALTALVIISTESIRTPANATWLFVPASRPRALRRLRFVTAESVTEIFRTAPAIDAKQFRSDLDTIAGQDITPRG